MVCTCFYDENDNFNDKRFILTSYNKAVKIEDKIRKSSTIFDGPNSSNNMDSARHNPLISSSALSQPKDTSCSLNEQNDKESKGRLTYWDRKDIRRLN